jgi:hypothetical protein
MQEAWMERIEIERQGSVAHVRPGRTGGWTVHSGLVRVLAGTHMTAPQKCISWSVLAAVWLSIAAGAVPAAELPPRNTFLAESVYPLGHGDSAQQDALPVPGPRDPGPQIDASALQYAHVGPAHFGAYTSSPYPDGRRVMWSNGLDRIVKIDFDTFEVLATHPMPDARFWTEADADESIEGFDASNEGLFAIWRAMQAASKLRDLSSVYTVLDVDNTYYIADKTGRISAYGDADPSDPASAIVQRGTFRMPDGVTGLAVGMNMTFDGWLIVPTEHGFVVAISRDLERVRVARLRHSEGAEGKATRPTGYGWVRNGVAIDERGGLYIASQEHMHKLVWTGDRLSTDPAAGAWTARYLNGWGHGTGATPSLMGFGDEDPFVVITDGEPLMNVVLFWRNAIPEDWKRRWWWPVTVPSWSTTCRAMRPGICLRGRRVCSSASSGARRATSPMASRSSSGIRMLAGCATPGSIAR